MAKPSKQTPAVPAAEDDRSDPTFVGYARVSTEDQSLGMQVAALGRAGVGERRMFTEKRSGVSLKRPARDLALKACRAGDTFVVWKLDRVGRSLVDLLRFLEKLEEMGIKFKSLQENIDTSTPSGKFFVAVIGATAQFERDLIAERTLAGVRHAQQRGIRFGQPPKITPEIEAEMEKLLLDNEPISLIAKRYKVAVATVRSRFNGDRLAAIRAKAARRGKRSGR